MSLNNPIKRRGRARDKHFRKTIILLEHEGQVKNFLKRLKKIKGQKLIIALSPFAMYELDKRGHSYKILEDYYDPKELYKLGINNYKKVENLCDIIDERIQNACPTAAKLSVRPALFSFYYLKMIYDAVTIRLFQLSKLIKAEKPDTLFICKSRQYPFGISEMAPYLLFDNRDSIYARLLACDGWDVPVAMLPYIPQPGYSDVLKTRQNIPDALKERMIRGLQPHPELYDLAAEIHKRGWRGLPSLLKNYLRARRDMRVLLFGAGYNWDDCRDQLQSAGISPIFIRMRDDLEYWMSGQFPDRIDSSALRNVWEKLRTDNKFRKFFTWGDIDFFPVVEERLRFLIERLTLVCLNAYEETAEMLKKRKIKAFLTSTLASCTSHSAAQASRNSNIPVVNWQHGVYAATHHPIVRYIDLMGSDMYFVLGEGMVDIHTEPAKRFGTRIIPIGSPSLEALYRIPPPDKVKKILRLTPEKKVVLYVSSTFWQNDLYISNPPPFSDNHFWRVQRAILDVLAKHRDYTIVIKTYPSFTYRESPMRLYAEENEFENCQFVRGECAFTELLPIADLLVIDSPTTTLVQALTTSKPIFVYTGHAHLNAQAQKLLKRRAFCYREVKSLVGALNKYLAEGKIDEKVDLNDKEFFKAFGISSQGVGSASRAAKMLKNIVSGVA